MTFSVNYVAVVVAAAAAFVIGFVWFLPAVFGNRWMAYIGKTREQLGRPGPSFGLAIVGAFVNAWVLAVIVTSLSAKTAQEGIVIGLLAWLGFMATITVTEVIFEKRPWGLWVLNNAHHALVQSVMGAILAVLR